MLGRRFQADYGDQCEYQVPSVARSRSRALWKRLCAANHSAVIECGIDSLYICSAMLETVTTPTILAVPKAPRRPALEALEARAHRSGGDGGTLGDRGDAWDNGPDALDAPATFAGPACIRSTRGTLKPWDTVVTTNLATRREGRRAGQVDWKGDSDLWKNWIPRTPHRCSPILVLRASRRGAVARVDSCDPWRWTMDLVPHRLR